ncbi:hypothetical protein [Arthrobacter sp. ISL-5]|uniref:hypothetical protein n=1 Tax=Arthrobacter sp. ISL-5 TaxID=2819111 RepID=UPI001BEB52A0|nr:hypothetical protein [Arthrobacter sp. ISL-5]MBT2555995.1 hypothetical protein [Arthrobacter sp. ISL-5]
MTDLFDYLDHFTDHGDQPPLRPPPKSPLKPPGPAPQVSACALAHAARDAVRDVLPAAWQRLPDGADTANVLTGVLANYYAAQQRAQQERLAAEASNRMEAEDGHG